MLQDSNSQFVGLTVAEDIAFSLENQQVHMLRCPRSSRGPPSPPASSARSPPTIPQNLSGGQKQRVAVAGVLVDHVVVLLLDEAAREPRSASRAAIELLDDLHRDQRKTILLVEHRLDTFLHRDIHWLVLMADGRIVADAAPDVASCLRPASEQHGIVRHCTSPR